MSHGLHYVFLSVAMFTVTLYNTNLRYVHTYLVFEKMPKLENHLNGVSENLKKDRLDIDTEENSTLSLLS